MHRDSEKIGISIEETAAFFTKETPANVHDEQRLKQVNGQGQAAVRLQRSGDGSTTSLHE